MKPIHKLLFLGACLIWQPIIPSLAQNLPVGFPALEEYYRRAQLLGETDSTHSFTSRPFNPTATLGWPDPYDPENLLDSTRINSWNGQITFLKDKGIIKILPQSFQVAYKRPAPFTINDGPMIPAKGFQTLYSGGVYAKLGPLSIRFQPEILFAENKEKWGFPEEHSNQTWIAYYGIYNYIDLPDRFGSDPYQRYLLGQSNMLLSFGAVSFGFSNENLWWGPGYRNSLMMTNSAPGFKHLTIHSNKPVKTWIGNFEFQLIGGKLDSSGFQLPYLDRDQIGHTYRIDRPNDWRYLNGFVFSFMPKWLPGLFFGITRSTTTYGQFMNTLSDYLPFTLPLLEKNNPGIIQDNKDHIMSFFSRYVLPAANLEFYFEYGREDRSADIRDLFLDFTHSRAYILGLKKVFPVSWFMEKSCIEAGFEMTQLEALKTRRIGGQTSWYVHRHIRHGYTHAGQMLGAGIGPGSNMQTFSLNWANGLKNAGIRVERLVHNNDLRYNAVLDTRRHWVDLIVSALGSWDYKNFIIHAQLDMINSHNYYWYYNPWANYRNILQGTSEEYWAHGKNIITLQALLGVTYRF